MLRGASSSLDQDVGEQAADQAVEDDGLGEGEPEPHDPLQLAAQLGLARDRLDHRAEDVPDAAASPEGAEAAAERERDAVPGIGAVADSREKSSSDGHSSGS